MQFSVVSHENMKCRSRFSVEKKEKSTENLNESAIRCVLGRIGAHGAYDSRIRGPDQFIQGHRRGFFYRAVCNLLTLLRDTFIG